MTIQSLIKTALWVTFWSWLFTGGAEAQCIHAPGSDSLAGGFDMPTQGDLLVLGLTVLATWALCAITMRWIPSLSKKSELTAAHGNQTALNNTELTDLQVQTDEALCAMQTEYEDLIVERLNTQAELSTDIAQASEVEEQRVA